MDNLIEYLWNPSTWISFIVFIFSLGVCYSNLQGKIKRLEEEVRELKLENNDTKAWLVKIQTQLAEIQTSIQYIQNGLFVKK